MWLWVSGRSLQRWLRLAGVVSFSSGCAKSDEPSDNGVDCAPPAELGVTLARDPSPLLGSEASEPCRIDDAGRLGRACLPRCSNAVRASFYACEEQGCEDSALAADGTLAITALANGTSVTLDCLGCVRAARSLCLARACPAQAAERDACFARADGSGCRAESAALSDCFLNHQHLYEPCLFLAVETCFSGE